ncbi:MAG: lipoate--protein ligase family protein [Planctomycetes bacterium]|nr:lipoate--protein ligase family protein [Planctomycetota bacterium]
MSRGPGPHASLRLLIDAPAEAAWNMAVDEALLHRGQGATLRLYGWSPHAVSLGYFQRISDFADLPASTPLVRRLTGGGAIYHGSEITFALAVDAGTLPRDIGASYRLLHDAAVEALAAHGITCERLRSGAPQHSRPQQRWCFATPGQDDLVTARGKLLGSAQRRIQQPRPRVLHHGSLVVHRADATPFTAAIADTIDLAPRQLALLQSSLATAFAAALRRELAPGTLTDSERELADELRLTRYAATSAFLHDR